MNMQAGKLSERPQAAKVAPAAPSTPADREYRSHIGSSDIYDIQTAIQFNLLTALGLRDRHYLLDTGCGSLRAGRLLIPYLQPGH